MAKVTMKDIAKASGWSLGTVSRVMSDAVGVNEKAREEVLQTARRLNYQKNDIASALRQKRPDGILIVVIA
ncbi:transcriptional regulator, LacI family, partial [gut metagenome]